MSSQYRAVVSALNHPDPVNGTWGLFNKRSLAALRDTGPQLDVVVPRPYAPPVGPFSEFSAIPDQWDAGPYLAHHPRFLYALPKRLLYGLSGRSFARTVTDYVDRTFPAPDVAHGCHLYPDGHAMKAVAESHGCPLTTMAHGTLLNDFESHPRSVKRAIRNVLVASDRVLCVSEALEARATEIAPAAETTHLPLGATPRNFPVERGDSLRRELDVPTDATVVLYCGQFSEAKGVDDLIRVLPKLTDGTLYPVCIGHGGDLRWDLHAALGDSGLAGQVHWKVDPVVVRRWFALADALVLPSYSEGRPMVVYEAMASRTPVIATEVGGIPEQVVDGETGWLFEPGNVDALRSLLESLDPVELEAAGERGRERLREQGWTWNDHAERLVAIHESLL